MGTLSTQYTVRRQNPPFLQKCLYQVRVITVFTVFQLLTDFVCLYTYEFLLSLCKIARSSVILLLPLYTIHSTKTNTHTQYEDKHTYTAHSTKTNKHTQHTVRRQTHIHNTQHEDKQTYTTQHRQLNIRATLTVAKHREIKNGNQLTTCSQSVSSFSLY